MTIFVIVLLILAVIGFASLAFFWRGMLVGRSQVPTSRQIMMEMQQVHAMALGGVVSESPKRLRPANVVTLNGRPRQLPPINERKSFVDDLRPVADGARF